jgi:hypothetical protein
LTSIRDGGTLEGLIRIGIIPTVAPYLVPQFIPHLRVTYPEVEVELREAVTRPADRRSFGRASWTRWSPRLPLDGDGIQTRPLFADRFFMAVGENGDHVLTSPLTEHEVECRPAAATRRGALPARPGAGGVQHQQAQPRQFRRDVHGDAAADGVARHGDDADPRDGDRNRNQPQCTIRIVPVRGAAAGARDRACVAAQQSARQGDMKRWRRRSSRSLRPHMCLLPDQAPAVRESIIQTASQAHMAPSTPESRQCEQRAAVAQVVAGDVDVGVGVAQADEDPGEDDSADQVVGLRSCRGGWRQA